MKALVLAGGTGTRLRPLTHSMAKQLVPVANKPVIHYIMEQITGAGIYDIGVIISPETGFQIKNSLGGGEKWQAQITYILQNRPAGLAHAVKTALPFLKDSPFLMFLGDNLIQNGVKQVVERFIEEKPQALVLIKEVANPQAFGVAVVDDHMRIIKLMEKPKDPPSNMALVGVYLFSPAIHQAIENIVPSRRGELEITDAIQELLNTGHCVLAHSLTGWWLDTGKKEDILESNRAILDQRTNSNFLGKIHGSSVISGPVQSGSGTRITDSIIHGPVAIGENCEIKDSFIGPYTSIGSNTTVDGSTVTHSVILENCRIKNAGKLEYSLIGSGSKVIKKSSISESLKFFLGEDTEVIIQG